jgi:CheY-like chemotaxis protein
MFLTSTKRNTKKKRKRIFLVDDEPDIATTIGIVLESNGFEVYSYSDPALALSSFRPHYYDLVILDIKMPKIDGFQIYNEIKKADDKVKVCFITATDKINYTGMIRPEHGLGENGKISQNYCALRRDMFLQKPISNDDLLNEIKNRIGE